MDIMIFEDPVQNRAEVLGETLRIYSSEKARHRRFEEHQNTVRTLELYGHLGEISRAEKARIIDRKKSRELGWGNANSVRHWTVYLLRSLSKYKLEITDDIYLFTLIDQTWRFGRDKNWSFDHRTIIPRVEKEIFCGQDYIAQIELAVHRQVLGVQFICPHVHGLVWGGAIADLRERARVLARDEPGADPLWLKQVHNLPGAIRYMTKGSAEAKVSYRTKNGQVYHKNDRLSHVLRYHILSNMAHLNYDDLAFAGGKGTKILRAARAMADARCPK